MARDLSGMSFGTTSLEPEKKERSAGEILADAGIGMLRGAASGKGILGILAGGALGAIEGDVEAERKQRMADLAEQQAKVDLENAKTQGTYAANEEKRKDSREKRAQKQFESGLENQREYLQIAKDEAARQKNNDEYKRKLDQEKAAIDAEERKKNNEERKMRMQLLANQMEEAENKHALAEADQLGRIFDSNMASAYGNDFDFEGMSIMRNSAGYRQARELYIIMKLYDRNPQMAQRLMKQGGWSVVPRSGPNGEEYDIVNDATGARFAFNETSMKALQENIQKNLNDGFMAGKAIGSPAGSLQQAAVRSVLTSKESQAYFGTQYDAAYADYRNFMQAGVQKGVFSDQDVATHVLNRTLQEAMQDGRLSNEEIAALVPQFQMSLQKFGGEIIPGADLKTTMVRLKDNKTITLDTLAEQLQQRDVIGARYKLHLAGMVEQRKAKERKAYEESLKIEGLERKAGKNTKKVNEIASPEAEFKDEEVSKLVSFGRDNAAKFNVDLPDDVQAANFGMGLAAAENAYSKYGLNYDAHMGYRAVRLRVGNQMPIERKDGQPLFLSMPALNADLQKITLLQQKNKESLASKDISSAQREQIEKTLKELSQKEKDIKIFLSDVSNLKRYADEKQIERDLKNDTTTYFTPFNPAFVLPSIPKGKKDVQRDAEKYKEDLKNGNGYMRMG
jgi:hypothetical protein